MNSHNLLKTPLNTCRSLLATTLVFSCAASQPLNAQESEQGFVEEVIVTGTPGGASLNKLDASFSITTASADDIDRFSPKSTADLLKIVPGVWAESSGGVSGANVFVRGFPGGGDAPFLTVQLNGSPVFPPPTLSFLENSTLFRIDETIERMEALRGGPNPVLSNGQPGLTTNFLIKKGSEETEGLVKYTASDYDLRRLDGYVSGELADDLFYMIGGYTLSSPGLRDAGFNAREGQQFTINIDKHFEAGTFNIYHRVTDDHGTWYLPGALNAPAANSNEYMQLGTLNRQRQIIFDNTENGGAGRTKTLDLGEGRGWDGAITGGSFEIDLDNGWTLVNRFSFTDGDADTLGLVPNGAAVRVADLIADPTLDSAAVITGPITGAVTGNAIADSAYIQQFGAWEVRKAIESFVNDFSLGKSWDNASVTLGYYSANSSTDEFWSLGNQKYHVVETGGEMVTGIACNDLAVDSCGWNYDIDATGDATTRAFYAALTYDISERITLDFGVRHETHEVEYTVDEGLDGVITKSVNFDESEVAWTAAVNFSLSDNSGVFARVNSGSRMPYFDDFRDQFGQFTSGNNLIQDVEQYELGYKFASDNISLYATGFYTEVDPSVFVALTGAGMAEVATNEALGLEIDANYFTDTGFSVNLNATVQETEIKNGPNSGNEAQRQPGWQLRVTPSYEMEMGNILVTLYGTLSAVDDRFSDNGNSVVLEGYEKLDLGVTVLVNDYLTFQVSADNVTDEDALTEGDPRNPSSPNGRFIMPASFKISVGYAF